MMTNKSVIKVVDVSKSYRLRRKKPTFAEIVINGNKEKKFSALKNINLIINKGERVGVIGDNGSGKTTLLKIISGITGSDQGGHVEVVGKIVSLIDLSAGFHPDLTGEENIFLSGILLGMSKKEIELKLKDIMEFSGLGDFIACPLYSYSGGMVLRLGFSIAIHSQPDILILDEGVNAGDLEFQEKIKQQLNDFYQSGKTAIIATHWMDYLKAVCQRIIWLQDGEIVCDGGLEILDKYEELNKR